MTEILTRPTMIALMARWNLAAYQKRAHDAARKEAEAKSKECDAIIVQCIATCKALGFDRSDNDQWDRALRLYGAEASAMYNAARDPSLPEWKFERPLLLEAEAVSEGAKQDGITDLSAEIVQEIKERPSVKEIALDRLKAASSDGAKAAEIRDFIQKTYGGEIHEKTVGMTLYRLLKEGKVRRDKHTWFIAQEAMNPGVPAPGSEASQTQTGKEG